MYKFYNILSKSVKQKNKFGFGAKRFQNTYEHNKEPKCDFYYDLVLYAVGMLVGYNIGKK